MVSPDSAWGARLGERAPKIGFRLVQEFAEDGYPSRWPTRTRAQVRRRWTGPVWCTDIPEHPTRAGKVRCAAVLDVFTRQVVGWSIADHIRSELVVDACRWRSGGAAQVRRPSCTRTGAARAHTCSNKLVLLPLVESGQYTSFAFTERLIEASVDASVGSAGDVYGNALAESQIGAYKTELIRPLGPRRDVEHLEIETLNWADWFNTERTHESIDDLTPLQAEEVHYAAR